MRLRRLRRWMIVVAIALALLSVQAPAGGAAPRLRTIASACPRQLPRQGFGDVSSGNRHRAAIDCLILWKVASGVTANRYHPTRPVTRAEMATVLARVAAKTAGGLPSSSRDAFADDERQGPHEDSINKLAAAGIVTGTADGAFLPTRSVTRGQIATMLVNTVSYASNLVIDTQTDRFADAANSIHAEHINGAAQLGLAAGLPGGDYRPAQPVRRDQMASFVARLLDVMVDATVVAVPQSRASRQPVFSASEVHTY